MTSAKKLDALYTHLDEFLDRYYQSMETVIQETLTEYLGRPPTDGDIITRGHRTSQNTLGLMEEKVFFDGQLMVHSTITFDPITVKIQRAVLEEGTRLTKGN